MKKRLIFLISAFVVACATILAASHLYRNNSPKTIKNISSAQLTDSAAIELPPPSLKGNMSVEEALYNRRSVRNYSNSPLSMEQVSQLLWSAYGVTKTSPGSGLMYKTAPSAGALYPLEVYIIAGNVESLVPGLYQYIPASHTLIHKKTGDLREEVKNACLGQKMIAVAPASIVFTAVYERTTSKYGKRGKERYVCMDLGHSAQNVYLQATAMGLGTCAIGAFNDDVLHKLLDLPDDEEVLYLMPVGKINDE
jgi:SagB-type dehydrogenase family enzyme